MLNLKVTAGTVNNVKKINYMLNLKATDSCQLTVFKKLKLCSI